MLTVGKQLRKRRNYPCRSNKDRGAGNVLVAGADNKWQFENPPLHHGDKRINNGT